MWQSFQPLPIYIFEHHKIINSFAMSQIFLGIFLKTKHKLSILLVCSSDIIQDISFG